ncbi:hypothetical protein U1Q18_018396 [Sarracenia purpurea var. burkii]
MMMKMKRKDLEEINDEFSDFSLSSPARKIRRLVGELPPIMEQEGGTIPLVVEQQLVPEEHLPRNMQLVGVGGSSPLTEDLPTVSENAEKAIVLFKPMSNTPLLLSPSNFTVTLNSDLMSGIKSLWTSQYNAIKSVEDEDEAARRASNNIATNKCLAVVPWIPPSQTPRISDPKTAVTESMESEDMGVVTMDIEENSFAEPGQEQEFSGMMSEEGLHQWQQQQQQHCMIVPQIPQNTSAPIVWFQ